MPELRETLVVAWDGEQYRLYCKATPEITIGHVNKLYLRELFDACALGNVYGKCWKCAEVYYATGEIYTYNFDDEYKKELAKMLIAKLVAINTGTDIYCGEDVLMECEGKCYEYPDDINAIIMDYLGLDASYAWLFK